MSSLLLFLSIYASLRTNSLSFPPFSQQIQHGFANVRKRMQTYANVRKSGSLHTVLSPQASSHRPHSTETDSLSLASLFQSSSHERAAASPDHFERSFLNPDSLTFPTLKGPIVSRLPSLVQSISHQHTLASTTLSGFLFPAKTTPGDLIRHSHSLISVRVLSGTE